MDEPDITIFSPGFDVAYVDEDIAVSKGIITAEREKDIDMTVWNRYHGKPEIWKLKKLKTNEEKRKHCITSGPNCEPKCKEYMKLHDQCMDLAHVRQDDYPGGE